MKAAIIINCNASQGRSLSRWKAISSSVVHMLPFDVSVHHTRRKQDVNELVPRLLHDEKCRVFIGGGGDGTINYLLNQIMEQAGGDTSGLVLGGIGLGSSNDFHKPIEKELKRIPLRLNFNNPVDHTIGQLDYTSDSGSLTRTFFLLNSSIGLTASANQFFNSPNRTLAFLKRSSSSLSIIYAALHTLLNYTPPRITEKRSNGMKAARINNMSMVKSPYLSGSFCYPELVKAGDRKFGVYYCRDMNRMEVLGTMSGMMRQRFDVSSKRAKFTSEELELITDDLLSIESDGEVFMGWDPHYSICKSKISIAGHGY
jgi:diacylglycerol kinase family enzyme